MAAGNVRKKRKDARHARVRRKVEGTPQRPRLAVFRSEQHIYAQVIDDSVGNTLAAASSIEKDVKGNKTGKKKADMSKVVGILIASRAKEKGIKQVVFDRGGFMYHGRVKALADAAREGGLTF